MSAGRIAPVIVERRTVHRGPLAAGHHRIDRRHDRRARRLDAADLHRRAPASTPPTIYAQLVDGIARSFLHQYGWKADLGRQRKPEIQALRATFAALAKPDHVIRGGTDEFDDAVHQLRDELDRHRRRLAGEPVVVPRIRLLISDDPGDPWIVRLELVDDSDSARWCTANDVWDANDTAIDVAKGAQHLDRLRELVGATVEQVKAIPGLADLALEHEPTQIELELDVAEDFLDIAPVELQRHGHRADRPRTADPHPGERQRRSHTDAGRRPQEAVRQGGPRRVEDGDRQRGDLRSRDRPCRRGGATLLHTGHRWVRIDADELRRKRAKLTELQTTKAVVTPIELLRLANDEASATTRTTRRSGQPDALAS